MDTQDHTVIDFPPRIVLCAGAVVLQERRVLFVRQAYGDLQGEWSLPWGFVEGKKPDGSVDPPHMAAVREAQEEGGVIAEVEGLLGIQNHDSRNGEPRVYILFLCRHICGGPTPDNRETDEAAYFSLEQMDMFDEPFDEFCEWVARRVLRNEHQVIPASVMNPYHPHLAFL
jgi:ADP-ribose pyrophosphatase YjhB (NUDIX family)